MPSYLKGTWIFIAALALDQLTKLSARASLPAESLLSGLPYISLAAERHPGLLADLADLAGTPDSGHSFAILAGLVLLALLFAGGSRARRVEGAEGPWWWLAAAGIGGNLVDRLATGGVLDFFHLHAGRWTLSANLADLLFALAMLVILGEFLHGLRAPRTTRVELLRPPAGHADLGEMKRGIDNVRIDVCLSPAFLLAARRLTQGLLYQRMGKEHDGSKPEPPSKELYKAYRAAYGRQLTAVVRRVKHGADERLLVLLHFAVIKALREATSSEFERQLSRLRARATTGMDSTGPRRILLNRHITELAHNHATLSMEVRAQLFEHLRRVEEGAGARIRESLLGHAWVVEPVVLFNPLLQGDDPYSPATAMRYYTLLGKREADWEVLRRFEGFFDELVRRALPDDALHAPAPVAESSWLPGSFWEERALEYGLDATVDNPYCQVPENVLVLCDPNHFDQARTQARARGDRDEMRRLAAQRLLQQRALRSLLRFAGREGLLRWIAAAYEMVPVYRQYYTHLNPMLLMQYLAGTKGRRAAYRQIRKAVEQAGNGSMQPLAYLRRRIRNLPRGTLEHYVVRFTQDLLTFRRDLRAYLHSQGSMERICLVEDADSIRLSRINGHLHELLTGEEAGTQPTQAAAHVIVKADLRGSTTITRDMQQRGLNPATHFDRHFFAPIRKLMEVFGAEKIFVEGDAIIAMLVDDSREDEHLAVARACGLARRMIAVAQANNLELAKSGLPALQTGIGIAFEAEPPAYLFDGEQRITISPAIGRADRLSSSSWRLRAEGQADVARRVRVFALDKADPLYGEKGQEYLRYNVGGISLEAAGFEQLGKEVDLRRVEMALPDGGTTARFHIARVSDAQGSLHLLAVRESPVLRWGLDGPGEATAGCFYEVVADPGLMRHIQAALVDETG